MKCPTCGGSTEVRATRGEERHRQCKADSTHRFVTIEIILFTGARRPGRPSKQKSTKDQMKRWSNLS